MLMLAQERARVWRWRGVKAELKVDWIWHVMAGEFYPKFTGTVNGMSTNRRWTVVCRDIAATAHSLGSELLYEKYLRYTLTACVCTGFNLITKSGSDDGIPDPREIEGNPQIL
ncbi:hypothetical protein EVAR_11194_1 [Eumeta japonica]|uniref:Uncharacterized protein n=1 Tax=Eumeta variegata TaxID=151549 RepID=A0A4C1U449_EUMVA|nr:hypothetical protein EVAR_11194_1 [Eumeta japonica]